MKCLHRSEEFDNGERTKLKGIVSYTINRASAPIEETVYEEVFTKDAKSKIRSFYKKFYQLVKKFID